MTSGLFTTADIGKTVYLSNSRTECQEWRIADVNHDGTVGTVDLFPKYLICHLIFGCNLYWVDGSAYTNFYITSDLRGYINGFYLYDGFTEEVKNALKVQSFLSNGEILEDKVKCPSLTEVGVTSNRALEEGVIYPIFGDTPLSENALAIYKLTNGNTAHYFTRSRYLDDGYSGNLCGVYTDGRLCKVSAGTNPENGSHVIACIRF